MLSEKLNKELNAQINREFYSGYLYLSMANYFHESNLHGFEHWCKKQAHEEVGHGMAILEFMNRLNSKIQLLEINEPETNFTSPIDTIKDMLNHEKYITGTLHTIAVIAKDENAFTTCHFLEKMLEEQIEEEETAYDIYEKLRMFNECKSALFNLDKELHTRV